MNPLRSGILYLFIILSLILGNLLLMIMEIFFPWAQLPVEMALSFGEVLILIPLLLLTAFFKVDIRDTFRIKRVRIPTLILVIPFTFMLYPIIGACNAFTLIFTDNVVVSASQTIRSLPFAVTFFIMSLFGPFTEEITFRGAEYAGLKSNGNIRTAILVQALMFGLMHLNLNQFLYAFVIGIAFGVLSEVTGSVLPGFFAHAIINGTSTVSIYITENIEASSAQLSKTEALAALQIYSVAAVFTTTIAVLLLFLIASFENGGRERLVRILRPVRRHRVMADGNYVEARAGKVFSIPALAGMTLASAVVIMTLVLELLKK
ncbi:lysostaphin resistance A-like protein [Lachnospiraceae bacterium C1.1]|nr:type II CAAX endopeptidase family protein [Lachnospiraceae bacterium C1.1]